MGGLQSWHERWSRTSLVHKPPPNFTNIRSSSFPLSIPKHRDDIKKTSPTANPTVHWFPSAIFSVGWWGRREEERRREKKSRRITSSSLTTKARVSTKSISLIRIAAWLASTYTRPTQRYRPLTYIYTHISAFVCVFEYGIFLATSKPVMHRPVTRTALIIKPFGACGRSLINVSTFKTN